jgi:hypothetical protein
VSDVLSHRRLLSYTGRHPILEEAGEEFARLWLDGGKKSTVNERPDGARVAIFAAPSTPPLGEPIFF